MAIRDSLSNVAIVDLAALPDRALGSVIWNKRAPSGLVGVATEVNVSLLDRSKGDFRFTVSRWFFVFSCDVSCPPFRTSVCLLLVRVVCWLGFLVLEIF